MAAAMSRDWIALLGAAAICAAPAAAIALTVPIDQNTVVDLGAPAGSIVIGNPSIADVSLVTPRRLAILGRAYGLTNIIVTDRMGHTIFRQVVNVAPAASGQVSVYRGALVANYACAPRCERTPMPGEDKTSNYEPYAGGYKDYAERARPDGQNQGGGGGGAAQ